MKCEPHIRIYAPHPPTATTPVESNLHRITAMN